MIRTIVIDDEKPSRDALCNYLNEYIPDVEVIATAGTAKLGLAAIRKHKPDMVFLDIEMPNGNGFDLLRQLGMIDFKIVFVTAYSEYAVRAFRLCATDYLLKPVNIKELTEAVEKVRNELNHMNDSRNLEQLQAFVRNPDENSRIIVIPERNGFKVVKIEDVLFCKADGYCTEFRLTGKQNITSYKHLKYYEDMLELKGFIRVHNSFLVNLRHVLGYIHDGLIQLSDGCTTPLGNTYKKQFLQRFKACK